jgi:hypothetical protein
MARFRLFATLSKGAGGRCRIWWDGRQHFLFERTRDQVLIERGSTRAIPNRFNRYVHDLCARGWSFAWAPTEGG